jgi:hypothetical protein
MTSFFASVNCPSLQIVHHSTLFALIQLAKYNSSSAAMGLFDRFKKHSAKETSIHNTVKSRPVRDGVILLQDSDIDEVSTDEGSHDEINSQQSHSIFDDIKEAVANNDVELHPHIGIRKRSESFIVVKPKSKPKTLDEQIIEIRGKILRLSDCKTLTTDEKEDLDIYKDTLRELVAQQRARSASSLSKLREQARI